MVALSSKGPNKPTHLGTESAGPVNHFAFPFVINYEEA